MSLFVGLAHDMPQFHFYSLSLDESLLQSPSHTVLCCRAEKGIGGRDDVGGRTHGARGGRIVSFALCNTAATMTSRGAGLSEVLFACNNARKKA